MLSHLRFHRRNPSNPTSPLPDQLTQWEAAALHEHPQTTRDISPRPSARPRSSNSSSIPPSLPPIARVTSSESEPPFEFREGQRPVSQDSRLPPPPPPYNGSGSGFIGGAALQIYRRGLQPGQRPESAGNPPPSRPDGSKPPPPPPTGEPPPVPVRASKPVSSFVAPTDSQASSGATGKRPAGTRLISEPPSLAITATVIESQKGKKGLPFLKNPMSTLLMRRRTSQNAPDILPLPINTQINEPTYDPRIRGTRVHDFSAPRPRRLVSSTDVSISSSTSKLDSSGELERPQLLPGRLGFTELSRKPMPQEKRATVPELITARSPESETTGPIETASWSVEQPRRESRRMSFDHKPLPEQPLPPLPFWDDGDSSLQASSSNASQGLSIDAASTFPKSSPSTKASFSRNVSLSGASLRSSRSTIPKHMKSTSSRFSFDMIGAAKQEKLLEERHRQRQLEKKISGRANRDSILDEFDDDFDYDAMMDDDGLEERIPGINADFDEEEEEIPDIQEEDEGDEGVNDPDNDQENFAGFVFQRSNTASALPSPHALEMDATPRDPTGNVIGFAMTKDSTPDLQQRASPICLLDPSSQAKIPNSAAGLGIQDLHIAKYPPLDGTEPQSDPKYPSPDAPVLPVMRGDDLYFDDGLADELDFENDGIRFDESLFDLNDTDQYGRPIPGVFAQAKSMSTAKQEAAKRESDMTSRLSAQSAMSQSTAHTSLSVELPAAPEEGRGKSDSPKQVVPQPMPSIPSSSDKVAMYQAALAEAAHKAAASGKFRRDSSPPPPAGLTITSPTDSSDSHGHSHPDPSTYDQDDPFSEDLDDFDFDDEAIIAEANASALANDSDGWYGQEFGFYSIPPSQMPHGHGNGNSNGNSNGYGHPASSNAISSASSGNAVLSAENLYQYANGGYFGPAGLAGVNRITGGRTREPNLTPITERSEYSNRNSIMSLALPPGIGGSAGGQPLHSPGLAQLAMMADDDNMSLSAFLRLRAKAFNGSQVSLASSSRDGSPRSDRGGGAGASFADGAGSPWGAGSGLLGVAGGGVPPGLAHHGRKNSAFSVWSRESDAGSGSGSPTLTMAPMLVPGASPPAQIPGAAASMADMTQGGAGMMMPPPLFSQATSPLHQLQPPQAQFPPVLEDEESRDPADSATAAAAAPGGSTSISDSGLWMKDAGGTTGREKVVIDAASSANHQQPPQQQQQQQQQQSSSRRPGMMGHRHKGSADSISYTKEEESSGETRWVVERRRTAESGEVEILGREVVEGGRI